MKIGILGAGNIGGTLGRRWGEVGHEVLYGVRSPQSQEVRALLRESGEKARAGSVADAIDFGEVVLLAVPGGAAQEALSEGRNWSGKVLIDAANRFSPATPSLSEEVGGWAPGAKVVKAFNTAGWEILRDPRFGDVRADTYICGDDAEAKAVATRLAREIGLDIVDAGPLSNAPLLDSMVKLWVYLSRSMGRGIAFKLLTR